MRSTTDKESSRTFTSPNITLSNGMHHPQIGYGTYKVGITNQQDDDAIKIITNALCIGYRFFDCAEFYKNESNIGNALSSVPRNELFICSKIWNKTIESGPDAMRSQCLKTLKDLRIDYLDLLLIHWPVPNKHVHAYVTLQELCNEGKIRGIGLSNYTIEDYLELKHVLGDRLTIPPVVNQIQISPLLYRKTTVAFFEKENIKIQAYRPFCKGKVFTNKVIKSIAKSYGKTVSQIVGRWCIQKGFIYFPKSSSKHRMIENFDILDFALTQEDMDLLDSLMTMEDLEISRDLYRATVNKDTCFDGTFRGVNLDTTLD